MALYSLTQHSYVCIADHYAVFLDLRRDEYSALEADAAGALVGAVRDWPAAVKSGAESGPTTQDCGRLVRALLAKRLLTDNELAGKPATPISIQRATSSLIVAPRQIPRVDQGHLGAFVASWLSVTTMLRFLPLRVGVERARRRKVCRLAAAAEFDARKAYELMMAYSILRPNFFTSANACLRDSMTVIEFLARYDIFPMWVFGVRMNPFAAHSWVQQGQTVLNDVVDHVNKFTPIMAI